MKHLLSAAALALVAGSAHAENVGITIARSDSAFLTILRNGMQDQAAKLDGVTVQVEDAQNDTSRQLDQVQNFVSSGVDAIIVVAVDGDSTPALTKMATDAGIPIVYANHPPADVDKLPETAAFVGSNEIDPARSDEGSLPAARRQGCCLCPHGTAQQSLLAYAHEGHS